MAKGVSNKNIENEISKSIIKLLIEEPFYAHILSGVSRKITNKVPTAAVGLIGKTITLFINEDFFLKSLTKASSKVAVIKHEVLHLVFKHIFRSKENKYDHFLYNLAADIVVNQYIGKWKLPESAVTLDTFPELNLEKNETLEWYYDKLVSFSDKNEDVVKKLNDLKVRKNHSDHSFWDKSNKYDNDSAQIIFGKLIVEAKKRTGDKDFDKLPLNIKNIVEIEILKQQQKIDWKSAIKIFFNSSKKTYLKYTYKRVSKRYGTRPGLKIKQHSKLLIALDTSGSIDNEELNEFFSEIHGIWKTGTEVDIVECDSEIQKHYSYKGKIPKYIHGRGGTFFDPVFEFINENRNLKYDGCIYLTDGYASKPKIKPYCPVIWVISPDGLINDHLWFGRITSLQI